MSTTDHYLAVFTSDKTGPRWKEWYGLTPAEQAERQAAGIPAVAAWEAAHREDIVHLGGPLGPTRRITDAGEVADIVNFLTVFVVVRAPSHEAAVEMFRDHPHMTIFPCDGVEVMPVLEDEP